MAEDLIGQDDHVVLTAELRDLLELSDDHAVGVPARPAAGRGPWS
jgi:hypothetical protein